VEEIVEAGPEYPVGTILINGLPYTRLPDGTLKARFDIYPDGTIHPHLTVHTRMETSR